MAVIQGGLLLLKELAQGIVNGHNTTFTSSYPFIPATLSVFLNGLEQVAGEDYTELDNHTVQFTTPPTGGDDSDVIMLTYQRL